MSACFKMPTCMDVNVFTFHCTAIVWAVCHAFRGCRAELGYGNSDLWQVAVIRKQGGYEYHASLQVLTSFRRQLHRCSRNAGLENYDKLVQFSNSPQFQGLFV